MDRDMGQCGVCECVCMCVSNICILSDKGRKKKLYVLDEYREMVYGKERERER